MEETALSIFHLIGAVMAVFLTMGGTLWKVFSLHGSHDKRLALLEAQQGDIADLKTAVQDINNVLHRLEGELNGRGLLNGSAKKTTTKSKKKK